MSIADLIFLACTLVLAFGPAKMLWDAYYPPVISTLLISIPLFIMSGVLWYEHLWLSTGANLVNAILWGILSYKRHQDEKRANRLRVIYGRANTSTSHPSRRNSTGSSASLKLS